MSMPGAFSPDMPPFEPDSKKDDTSPAVDNPPPLRLNQPSDAFSLQTNDPYYDDIATASSSNAGDLPPSYTDEPSSLDPKQRKTTIVTPLLADESGLSPLLFRRDPETGAEIHCSRRLDTDPAFLESHITSLAQSPPRPYLRVRGTHTESIRKRDDKTESKTVVDFDVRLDLTPFLYRDIAARRSWRELRTADNFQKVRRGTVFPTRAPGFGGRSSGAHGGAAGEGVSKEPPTLREWCHRYCASHAGLKTFSLLRTVPGFDDDERLKSRLEDLVRATNYRGHIDVSFPVQDARVDIYSTCRVNRWRHTTWVRWLFYLTFLWIFAWPYLFFRTKRFEVVEAEWPFSRRRRDPQTGRATGGREYVSLSELDLYNMWGRAISKAVLQRRQGELDQRDLRDAEGRQDTSFEDVLAGIDQETTRGLVRAGVSAMNAVNRHYGWGDDR
ncbi:hypothetical protein CORC01_01858 [Colletotrichum orchidophilum]|uniref:Uncharacterized protein n=1 Tax=Colletotrichum orchidophilum TaxID=1209926 RepID=A0A1G4BN73_9PEZI|nr:uncharacterized protein CORC01_01858 [Colletotrichum orchidophilum]OHF02757.1 hypothetical protein CORC01_01858 [Colletotrichum orchidophilum]